MTIQWNLVNPRVDEPGGRWAMKWAPSELDHYSHAVTPLAAQHPDGGFTAVCGYQLPGVPVYEDASGLKCPQCVLDLLAREWDAPAACTCTAAKEIACLRARLIEFIKLADALGLWASQSATLAHQARSDLDKLRGRQLAELAQRWIARQLPEKPHPLEDGGAP